MVINSEKIIPFGRGVDVVKLVENIQTALGVDGEVELEHTKFANILESGKKLILLSISDA
jgi:hypothetical protein